MRLSTVANDQLGMPIYNSKILAITSSHVLKGINHTSVVSRTGLFLIQPPHGTPIASEARRIVVGGIGIRGIQSNWHISKSP